MAEPKLRFRDEKGGCYQEWNQEKFSDIFTLLGNNTLSRAELNYDNGVVKNVHYGDILTKFGSFVDVSTEALPYISNEAHAEKAMKHSLMEGDIVIADTAEDETVGKTTEIVNLFDTQLVSGLHTIPCRPVKDKFASKFLGYYMNSNAYHKQLRPLMQGIKVTSISKSAIMDTDISVPETAEQQKIADLLSYVDEVTTLITNEIRLWEEKKKGVMQKIFSQEVRFKDENGEDYPEWEESSIGEIFETITDYVAAGSFAEIAKNVVYKTEPDYAQLIRTVDIKKDFKDSSPVFVDEKAFHFLWRVNLDKEYIVMPNIGANIGEIYYVYPQMYPKERNVLGPNAILLGTTTNTMYWSQYFQSVIFQKQLKLIIAASGQPKFNKTELKRIKVYKPTSEEQQKIADCLSSIDEVITIKKQKLETWKNIKKGLLQQMFV